MALIEINLNNRYHVGQYVQSGTSVYEVIGIYADGVCIQDTDNYITTNYFYKLRNIKNNNQSYEDESVLDTDYILQ